MSTTRTRPQYYLLKNLSSRHYEPLTRHPHEAVMDLPHHEPGEKKLWTKPEFEGYFLTMIRALDPTQRVGLENPARMAAGLILDFDQVHISRLEMNDHIKQVVAERYQPSWLAKSYSGGFHLHYEFEDPFPVESKEAYEKFVTTFISKAGLSSLPGQIDVKAVVDPSHVYEIGREWSPVRSGPTPTFVTAAVRESMGALLRNRWQYSKAASMDMSLVVPLLKEKYPDADVDWDAFRPGGRCLRLYDPDARDKTACKIWNNGLQQFTKGDNFIAFSDKRLCGMAAIQEILDLKIAVACEGIFQCGKEYWRELGGRWETDTKDAIKIALKTKNISSVLAKGEAVTEMDRSLEFINQTQRVIGVGPQLYRKSGGMRTGDGHLFLNTSKVRPFPAAKESGAWGEGFPIIAAFFDGTFRPDAKKHELQWLAHAYQNAVAMTPCQALGKILIGAAGVGKNFYARGIVGQLLGGVMDPQEFLLGTDQFNKSSFNKPLWYLSDIPSDMNAARRRVFSERLKKCLADAEQRARGMYSEAVEITWHGRLIMACNDDSISLDALPSTGALYDKLSYTELLPTKMKRYPTDEELAAGELAHFAAYLRDLVIEPEDKETRYGLKPFHDPAICGVVEAGSIVESREEMLHRVFYRMGANGDWTRDNPVSASSIFEWATNYPNDGFRATFKSNFHTVTALGRCLAKEARTDERITKLHNTKGATYQVEFTQFLEEA